MDIAELIKTHEDRSILNWFKDHVAEYECFTDKGGNKIETILFHRPKDSAYWVRYYAHLGFLHVVGDIGEAIHQWSYSKKQQIDLKWISETNFSYYMGKLRAGEKPNGKTWDENEAKFYLKQYLDTKAEQWLEEMNMNVNPKSKLWATNNLRLLGNGERFSTLTCNTLGEKDTCRWREFKHAFWSCEKAIESEHDWHHFLEENGNEVFGEKWYEYANIGLKYDIRHKGHWLGLKLAFEALKKNQM